MPINLLIQLKAQKLFVYSITRYGELNHEFSKTPMHTSTAARTSSDFMNSAELPDLTLQPLAMGCVPWPGLRIQGTPLWLLHLLKAVELWQLSLSFPGKSYQAALLDGPGGTGLPGHGRWGWLSCPAGVWWHGSGRSERPRAEQSGSPESRHPQEPCAAAGASHIPRGPPGLPCGVGRAHSVTEENRTAASSNPHLDCGT